MKHIVIEHNLPLFYGALKTNKAAWDKLDSEIQVLKSVHSIESDKKILQDSISQRAQTHAVIILITNFLIEALINFYLTDKRLKAICGLGKIEHF
jgi:hypothetical protein